MCTDCKNGIGVESPPGLRGHSMVIGDSGILIYGGTEWTMTNHTVQDAYNKAKEIFQDTCKMYLTIINTEKSRKDKEWTDLTTDSIGTY